VKSETFELVVGSASWQKGAKGEAWDRGAQFHPRRQNLVKMKKGGTSSSSIHSNEGKEIVGIAEIIKEGVSPTPSDKDRQVRLRRT